MAGQLVHTNMDRMWKEHGHCLIIDGTISHQVLDRRLGQVHIQSVCYNEHRISYLLPEFKPYSSSPDWHNISKQ
jgi:hypothetical protein